MKIKFPEKFIVLILFVLTACSQKASIDKPLVTVSILPQKYFVEKIAGDLVDVNVLIPPGASPATYSLMASQMTDLDRSDVWLRIGKIGFEESWEGKISQSTPDLKIIDTSVGVDWIEGDHEHGIDPHIWLSPNETKIIVDETFKALKELYPEYEVELTSGYLGFKEEIERLDEDLTNQFAEIETRTFFIFHPALTYMARQYGLTQVALEVEGKEPSPKYLQSVIDLAKSEDIKVIFIQKEFDAENASQLAREIGGEVIQIDPLNEDWENQIREITDKIIRASN